MEARLDDYTKYHYGACPCCGKPIRPKASEAVHRDPDLILDNMAGSGTMMLACTLGRDVVLVELEDKFCKMMTDNWEEVRMRPQLGSVMGNCQIIQGDARQLEGLVDKIVTSPPYAEAESRNERSYQEGEVAHMMSRSYVKTKQGKSAGQISNLPYGQIDKIVTNSDEQMLGGLIVGEGSFFISSQKDDRMKLGHLLHPRFSLCLVNTPADKALIEKIQGMLGCDKIRVRQDKRPNHRDIIEYWVYKIDDLVDRVIPLCNQVIPPSAKRVSFEKWKELVLRMKNGEHLTPEGLEYIKARISGINNPEIDVAIFGPPYENAITGKEAGINWSKGTRGKAEGNKPRDKSKEPAFGHLAGFGMPLGYSESQDNIGNLKSQSYLEAMLQVYQSCFAVLRDGGLMILVTKNFIRNKQVVRLDTDTIKLCEQAGFSFLERHYRKLPSQSFWRVIYSKKYPSVPMIDYEDVLVFAKR